MKNSKLWYEARDAIQSGTYLKAKTKTLRKYLEELSIVQPWEHLDRADGAVQVKLENIAKIKTELQRRKDECWASFHFYKRGIIIGVVVGILLLIIAFLFRQYFAYESQEKQKIQKSQLQNQNQVTKVPVSSASQQGEDQQKQKLK